MQQINTKAGQERAGRVLVIEDDQAFGEVLAGALRRRGLSVRIAATCDDARSAIAASQPEFAVLDLRIGHESGLSLLPLLTQASPPTRTVVLTGYGSIATAVEAIKLGATQYLTKPVEVDELLASLIDVRLPTEELAINARPLSVRRAEWEHIQRVLTENGGNISATARALGIHRRTLQRKLQKKPRTD